MTSLRQALLAATLALSAQAADVTFCNLILGSPLLITRLDLTLGNGVQNLVATHSLFFDLPGGPGGFATTHAYTTAGNGLVTGIETVDAPEDGPSDRSLSLSFFSSVTGGDFVFSSAGANCGACDSTAAATFRHWLASDDANRIIVEPNFVDLTPRPWSSAPGNFAVLTLATETEGEDAGGTAH